MKYLVEGCLIHEHIIISFTNPKFDVCLNGIQNQAQIA